MVDFSAPILAQLEGRVVRAAPLVHFAFKSGDERLWPGFASLSAEGYTWKGIGNMGTMSPISSGTDGSVEEMTFTLFGSAAILANIRAAGEDVEGQEVNVYMLFFDVRKTDESGNWVDWKPLPGLLQTFWGIMGPPTISREPPSSNGRAVRTISVRAASAFTNRARPPYSFFSDRDQKSRDATGTDNIFSRMPKYSEGTARWPQY